MVQLSDEVRAITNYLWDSGVAYRTTSTFRFTATRHGWPGTNGMGLAVDAAGPHYGRDTAELKAIFDALWQVRGQLRELYYSGPGVTMNIRHGMVTPIARIPQLIRNGHHDHVHVSVTKGTFIKWPHKPPPPPEPKVKPMFDPPLYLAAWTLFTRSNGKTAVAGVDPEGHVYCEPADAFVGAPNGKDYWGDRKASQIKGNKRGGYTVTASNGEKYSYPEGQ